MSVSFKPCVAIFDGILSCSSHMLSYFWCQNRWSNGTYDNCHTLKNIFVTGVVTGMFKQIAIFVFHPTQIIMLFINNLEGYTTFTLKLGEACPDVLVHYWLFCISLLPEICTFALRMFVSMFVNALNSYSKHAFENIGRCIRHLLFQ